MLQIRHLLDGAERERLLAFYCFYHPQAADSGVDCPAARDFCRWLSASFAWARGARLPTEEEWEYACRAGSTTREQPVPEMFRPRVELLLSEGILERVGRGRGSRLLLSRRFYRHLGKAGAYTRKRGLDRETNKQLLLKHIRDNAAEGSKMEEFRQVLPALRRSQIQVLLRELARKGAVHVRGATRAARWYPGSAPADCNRTGA